MLSRYGHSQLTYPEPHRHNCPAWQWHECHLPWTVYFLHVDLFTELSFPKPSGVLSKGSSKHSAHFLQTPPECQPEAPGWGLGQFSSKEGKWVWPQSQALSRPCPLTHSLEWGHISEFDRYKGNTHVASTTPPGSHDKTTTRAQGPWQRHGCSTRGALPWTSGWSRQSPQHYWRTHFRRGLKFQRDLQASPTEAELPDIPEHTSWGQGEVLTLATQQLRKQEIQEVTFVRWSHASGRDGPCGPTGSGGE